ncbi:MAG: transporter substrate-binding domain-containing protein [Clostridiales Family XIII bacterium]|nr:transporter substrate-binding domain-containing protein [Clostridiales Family XIII bacterium]
MKTKITKILIGLLTLSLLFAVGCSKSNDKDSGEATDGEKTKLIVSSQPGEYPPLIYVNENGENDGIDFRIIKALQEELPQYEFEVVAQDMATTLTALDSGTVDVGLCMFEYNEQRAEKYVYSDVGYMEYGQYIVVPKGNPLGIKSLDDLGGKRVSTYPSSNTAFILEDYNANHPDNQIEIVYVAATDAIRKGLQSGDTDATLSTKWGVDLEVAQFGDYEEIAGESIWPGQAYVLFPRTNENKQVQADVNAALKRLVDSGEAQRIYDNLLEEWKATLK